MTEVMVVHPEGWIGVPEVWPNVDWATPEDWAPELVAELEEGWGAPEEAASRGVVASLLVELAGKATRQRARAYCRLGSWTGPFTTALMSVVPGAPGDPTVEELANDPMGAVEKPIVEPFTTDSGVEGFATTRYVVGTEFTGLIARLDYLWKIPGGFIWLYTANIDLVAFERDRQAMAELAGTVRIVG
jgi:hypothetical protein